VTCKDPLHKQLCYRKTDATNRKVGIITKSIFYKFNWCLIILESNQNHTNLPNKSVLDSPLERFDPPLSLFVPRLFE